MTNLTRFESNDGIELVINTQNGDVYYPGYRALARVCSIGLEKPIYDTQVKRTVESVLEGATDLTVEVAEILTPGGLQGATLIPRRLGTKVIKKYNEELYEAMADAGHLIYLHRLAGYKVALTPTVEIPKILTPEYDKAWITVENATQQYSYWESKGNVRMMAMWETRIFQCSQVYLALLPETQPITNGQPTAITGAKDYEGVVDVVIRLGLPWNSRFESPLGTYAGKRIPHLRISINDDKLKDYRNSQASNKQVAAYMYPAFNSEVEEVVREFCMMMEAKSWRTQAQQKAWEKENK